MRFAIVRPALATLIAAAALGLTPTATTSQRPARDTALDDARHPLFNQGPKQVAVGDKAMVSTQHPEVTMAAVKVLQEGGNAVDAAITATFLQNVIDYHQVQLFGAMTGIYYEAKTGTFYAFNAYAERPLSDRSPHGDPMKVSIAGKVKALEQLHKRFGTKPWAGAVQPAIETAERGVLMTSFMYGINYASWAGEEGVIRENKAAREFYMPNGHLVPVGERWKMPALAETLRKVAAEGSDYLYKGAWAQKFVKEATNRGGRVSIEDLADYEVIWQEPIRFTYRGHEIVSEPPPVAGGVNLGYALNILEQFDLKKQGHYTQSIDTLDVMARSLGRVENEIRYAMGDPRSFKLPTEMWLSKDYARWGADFVRSSTPRVSLAPAETTAMSPDEGRAELDKYNDDSNHNTIVDPEGNWISYLHTGHGGMPGVFIDGIKATGSGRWTHTTGPGRRASTAIAASFIVKDGKPWLGIGSPGLPAQPITEVLVNIIDFGMSPKDAADAPRFWAYRDRGVSRDFGNLPWIEIESRISDAVRKGAAARGMKLKDIGPYNWNTGSMQIVWRDPATGKLHGVSDPRRLGHAAGF